MEENQNTTESQVKNGMNPAIPIAIIGIVVIVAVGIFMFQGQQGANNQMDATENAQQVITPKEKKNKKDAMMKESSNESMTNETETPAMTQSDDYKDGEYSAVGDYMSPGGAEEIGVTLTLKNGVIESAEVETIGDRPNTVKFQEVFKDNFKQYVIGKNIDEVMLDKVAGSSLSPKGFNDAIEKIKSEAQA